MPVPCAIEAHGRGGRICPARGLSEVTAQPDGIVDLDSVEGPDNDQEQTDKFLEIKDDLPLLKKVI